MTNGQGNTCVRILLLTGTCRATVVICKIVASANRMGGGGEESNDRDCCKWEDRAFHFRARVVIDLIYVEWVTLDSSM